MVYKPIGLRSWSGFGLAT